MENSIKMDDLGVPFYLETPKKSLRNWVDEFIPYYKIMGLFDPSTYGASMYTN